MKIKVININIVITPPVIPTSDDDDDDDDEAEDGTGFTNRWSYAMIHQWTSCVALPNSFSLSSFCFLHTHKVFKIWFSN